MSFFYDNVKGAVKEQLQEIKKEDRLEYLRLLLFAVEELISEVEAEEE
jgi:hypothetical protein